MVVQKMWGLTARDAQQKIDAREWKEKEKEAKGQQRVVDKFKREERKEKYRQGVEARDQERKRKKKVKELEKTKQNAPPELLVPIPDPEKIWLAKQEQEELRRQLEEQQRD